MVNYLKQNKITMAFCDSHLFDFDEEGNVVHRRSGSSYADKVIDGVRLDDSLHWENDLWHFVDGSADGSADGKPIVVGNKGNGGGILTSTKSPGKERGEGKFYRKRKATNNNKKFPTKPKHSWHRRLSKVAQELGNLEMHTEENASAELDQVYCDIELVREEKELKERNEYWSQWLEKVKDKPGSSALVELDVSLIPGEATTLNHLYTIDCSGINRTQRDPHGFVDISNRDPSYGEYAIKSECGDWLTEKKYYFTYWDEHASTYKLLPLSHARWRFKEDPYDDFERFKEIFSLPNPSGSSENNYYYHWDDLNWENVWVYMDYLRTGLKRGYRFTRRCGTWRTRQQVNATSSWGGYRDLPAAFHQIPKIEFITSY